MEKRQRALSHQIDNSLETLAWKPTWPVIVPLRIKVKRLPIFVKRRPGQANCTALGWEDEYLQASAWFIFRIP